eukprot:10490519-Alexandrium_andersonii.AAC.1
MQAAPWCLPWEGSRPPRPLDCRLRRERPHWGGDRSPGPPLTGTFSALEAPIGGSRGQWPPR